MTLTKITTVLLIILPLAACNLLQKPEIQHDVKELAKDLVEEGVFPEGKNFEQAELSK